jgi:hypothetical protein
MNVVPSRDRSLVFFGLLAVWIGFELLTSSRWLAIRSILQQPIGRSGAIPGSLASLLQRPPSPTSPKVWFAPYTSFPEPGLVESRFRSGVYDTLLAFPSSGIASNYGAFKLGPADLLFTQASSQGLKAEAQLARDLGYQWFALDLGALESVQQAVALCKQVKGCHMSSDGYALFPLDQTSGSWFSGLHAVQRRIQDFPQLAAGYRWAGVVLRPGEWFVPESSDLLLEQGNRPLVRIWATPLLSNGLFVYRDQDLRAPVASRLQSRQRRLWLTLAPGVGGADLCLQGQPDRPCLPLRLRQNQPAVEITRAVSAGQVSTINSLAFFGPQGQPIRGDQLPFLPGSATDRAIFGLEIQ